MESLLFSEFMPYILYDELVDNTRGITVHASAQRTTPVLRFSACIWLP